jgi:hypothetical protein
MRKKLLVMKSGGLQGGKRIVRRERVRVCEADGGCSQNQRVQQKRIEQNTARQINKCLKGPKNRKRNRLTSSGSDELEPEITSSPAPVPMTTGDSVQLGSKYVTSRFPLRWGLKGGSISFLIILFQSTEAKKGCAIVPLDSFNRLVHTTFYVLSIVRT